MDNRIGIVSISSGMMDADALGPVCHRLSDVNVDLRVTSANSEQLDDDEESFMDVLSSVRHSDVVVLKIHSDPSHFKKFDRLKSAIEKNKIPFFLDCNAPEILKEYRSWFPYSDEDYDIVRRFIELGGDSNNRGLLLWFCSKLGKVEVTVPIPEVPRAQGLYHPDMPQDIDESDYLDSLDNSKPKVGILFHQKYWNEGNIDHIDALIRRLEELGAETIPVFFIATPSDITGSIGIRKTIEKYFMDEKEPRIGSVIISSGFSQLTMSSPEDRGSDKPIYNFFKDLDVAILQATTILKSRDAWKEDIVGMGPIEISTSVIWPEFDGQIITVPLQFMERDKDGNYRNRFIPDRVNRIAELAIKWSVLRGKNPSNRRFAVMLNMYPPSNDRLGGAGGLDTFESIRRLMIRLKDMGYFIDHIPETSKELLDEIMKGLTNDLEWVPENEIRERAADMIDVDHYMEWGRSVPDNVYNAICRNWGDPPGEITTHQNEFIIPGIRNGNMFIGIQPNRGHHAHVEQFYHSTDVVMPHQYLAYYRWIKDVFKADVLIHMGTHGTLEWLPGKGNGLSDECYPDVVQNTMSNVYPYIIDDPGEGMEAKRRTNSVLIGYMVAAMVRAEGYEDLADLDNALQAYLNTESTKQVAKSIETLDKICDLIEKLEMWKEIGLEKGCTKEEVGVKTELIYDYISDLKDATIKDGLHILGYAPEGIRLKEMVYCMTRLRNGSIPSLRSSVSQALGFDVDSLLDAPSGYTDGELNGTLIDTIDSTTQALIDEIFDSEFNAEQSLRKSESLLGKEWRGVEKTVKFICETLHPNIQHIADEMDLCVLGTGGGYVPPGPSGSPTRGNAHLLPTGKNYYSIDPNTIPNDASWNIGRKMAEDMIERFVKDNGSYPENVGIIVWATDTMKTGGDDIAYVLYLMGLKPQWSAYGGRVIGLEVIPLDELNRPRIDVTLRISGMFRDSFPNLVNLIDDGVEMISNLDEGEESNFLKKHLKDDMLKYIQEGLSEQDAKERSSIRIFGDPPGEHGCGTGVLIESSQWDSIDDLAQVYTTWGSYAYGRKWKGEKMMDEFKRRMSQLNVTVKNHNDREFDLLDIDDDYEVLGGLNAVVRAYGGYKPYTVMGDSSDVDRLKTRTLEEETAYVMRSRVLNPKWLEGLKPHGFRGAMELSKLTEYMLGWDATSGNIEDWMYEAVTEKFILDEETRQWIDENNPYALKEMIEDLIETIDRDLWDAPTEIRDKLQMLYLESEGRMEELSSIKK